MTTITLPHSQFHTDEHERFVSHRITRYAVPVGRTLFALIFLASAPMHFSAQTIAYARSTGVPMASLLVPASGVLSLLGALSLIFGYKARFGALLLALFLIPVTLMMHKFWTIQDPVQAMMQQVMFMKNTALLGAALFLTHFGAGPISLDAAAYKRESEALVVTRDALKVRG